MIIFNHYSFLLLAGISFTALVIHMLRRGMQKQDLVALGALVLGFTLAFGFFQPVEATAPITLLEETETQETPILIQFQSPYCLGCMAARPMVNELLDQASGELAFIAIDINDPGAVDLTTHFRARYTPTFILLDMDGSEVYRSVGAIDTEAVLDLLHGSSASDGSGNHQ